MESEQKLNESDFRDAIALCPNCTAIFKTGLKMQFRNAPFIDGMAELGGEIPCPVCSYIIKSTKNSLYDFVEETFEYLQRLGLPELFFLRDSFEIYHESEKSEKDQQILKSKISKVAPKLFSLKSFIPANSGELASWITLIATITFGVITSLQSNESNKTTIILNNVGNTEVVQPKVVPDTSRGVVGRNDLCPCGSGKKFKRCHGLRK